MAEFRKYQGYTEAECWDIALRRISNSFDFKSFIASKCKVCPKDLVVSCYEYKGVREIGCSMEKVSWDVPYYESPEDAVEDAVVEYFKTREPEIWKQIKPYWL